MKVILYMAITVNGLITGKNDDTSWVSEEDFAGQEKVAGDAGNIIYGRRTYEIGIKENCLPIPGCLNIVITSKAKKMKPKKGFLFSDNKPKEIIKILGEKGFKKVVVAGGSILNHSFMKDGLIDELFLDVEPMVFGQGIPLFAPADFEFKLELLGVKNLSEETIQLHYKIIK